MSTRVRYSALAQTDDEEDSWRGSSSGGGGGGAGMDSTYAQEAFGSSGFEFGTEPGTFQSAFTYANYNDLDNMGYAAPKRYGYSASKTTGNRFNRFTYSRDFEDSDDEEREPLNALEKLIFAFSIILVVLTMPFSLLFTLKFVSSTERMVVLRLGRAQKPRGPGTALVIPCIDHHYKVDTRVTAFNVPPLQIITADRGLIEIGAVVYLRIRDVVSAVCGVKDRNNSTRTLASTLLYRYVNKKRVCEISNSNTRRIMAEALKEELGGFTSQFGVEITNIDMSEVKVLKDGENMAMAALGAVAKSDVGQQMWSVFEPHVKEIMKESQSSQSLATESSTSTDTPQCSRFSSQSTALAACDVDIDRLITHINLAIDPVLTRLVSKVFQVNLRESDPFYIDLRHGQGVCQRGEATCPDVVFDVEPSVFASMLRKEVSPVNAYMSGTLKVVGSMSDAMSLKHLVERVADIL